MTGYTRILIGCSTESASKVLEDGIALGKILGTEIDVVHFTEFITDPMDYNYMYFSDFGGSALLSVEDIQTELEKARKRFAEELKIIAARYGVDVNLKEGEGNPAQTIVDMSSEYSLVVVDSDTESEDESRTLGPTAKNVVRFAESPVLVMREWQTEAKVENINKILVPVDGSPVSNFAAAHAGILADKLGATVTLLHAWDKKEEKKLMKMKREGVSLEQLKEFNGERILGDAENTLITTHEINKVTADGDPRHVVEAMSENFDLVIMGTWGKSGIKKFLLGGTAEHVAQHAKCPVLMIRGVPEK